MKLYLPGIAATLLLFAVSTALGGELMLPESGSTTAKGPALTVTNEAGGTPMPSAILGRETGPNGIAIAGSVTGSGSIAVLGENGGSGTGGSFVLYGPKTGAADSAVKAVNTAGASAVRGDYGSAGIFQIRNPANESPAVSIETDGTNGYALRVINTGTSVGKTSSKSPDEGGGIAGFFEISGTKTTQEQTAIYVKNSGGNQKKAGLYGSAANFEITNAKNQGTVMTVSHAGNGMALAATSNDSGTGVSGILAGATGCYPLCGGGPPPDNNDNFTAVSGTDNNSGGGVGIMGSSSVGFSGFFVGGGGGGQACAFDGGYTWTCSSPAAMMQDLKAPRLGEILDRLDALPVNYYEIKGSTTGQRRYLGPSAEDFRAAFGLGRDDKTIVEGNAYGVALAAAKDLHRQLKDDEAVIAAQRQRIAALDRELASQRAAIASMASTVAHLSQGMLRQARLTRPFERQEMGPP